MERDLHGSCGVCMAPLLEQDLVLCPACRALYHYSCWTFNRGRCAVYGCAKAHAGWDPLPSLSAVRWTGKEPPIRQALPDPAPETSHIRGDISAADWVLVALAILIVATFTAFPVFLR